MDEYDFEHFVADLWERMGWQTEVSAQTADKGIDVIATRHSPYEEKALIQAKRYGPTTTVGSPDIQQYASLKQQRHGVDKVLVVTTNGFSKQAAEIAHQLNVKLVDGDDLIALLEEFDARDLVERYAPAIDEPEPDPEPATSPEPRMTRPPTGKAEPIDTLSATGEGIDNARTVDSWDKELTEREESKGHLARRLPAERWKWVAGATGAWVLGVALAGADGGLVMLVAWVGLPYAILKDGHWTRWRRWYAAAALLPVFSMFVGAWYLLIRWRAVGFESAGDDIERTDTTEERPREYHESESRVSNETDAYDHYTEAVDDIKRLKRERKHDEAESLLWWCIEAAERQALEQDYDTVPPWYYKHLAIIYRKDGRHDDEVKVLKRYVQRGGENDELFDRLETARRLVH